MDMKIEPFLLVSTMNVIIAQPLIRKLGKEKEKHLLTKAEIDQLAKIVDLDRVLAVLQTEKIVDKKAKWDTIPFYKPKSSKDAEDGYSGRVGIHEVLKVSQTIKDLVMKGETSDAIEKQAKAEGMSTMIEDGVFKAAQGLTTIEEVLRVISE
jgi:type II secretory ATPase GspE/PulE/Tfp pilus assembly ATPase PilB-like protein